MELHELGALTGETGERMIAACSVLEQPEPLVLRVDEPVAVHPGMLAALRRMPTVVVLVGDPGRVPRELVDAVDVALTTTPDPPRPWHDAPLGPIFERVAEQPLASLALVSLLRVSESLPVWEAVAAEAATYGMLLGSDAHRHWLDQRPPPPDPPPGDGRDPVCASYRWDVLFITLDRPEVHNAVNTALRDRLVAVLDSVGPVEWIHDIYLRGRGPSFCSGGDIHEFGTVPDGATSHAVRLTRHPGLAVYRETERVTAHLHGHCIGAGIEIPAFAGRVVAAPRTKIRLPELGMGLVPGAGGTVSLPRRIGRHRTAWLALSGDTLDARTALRWGLVDEVEPKSDWLPSGGLGG
jgi:enoyl-CoA hydratase/carnithine racemase